MNRFSITWKIWLSTGIFVLGFISSTILVQVQGTDRERVLQATSEALFPAAQFSQEAEGSFQAAVRAFGDAVVMQDDSGLQRATGEGARALGALERMTTIRKLQAERRAEIRHLIPEVEAFLAKAKQVYGAVVRRPASIQELQGEMRYTASETMLLKTKFRLLKERSSQDLQGQLKEVRIQSQQQRWFSLLVFGVTVIVAAVMVNLTIHRVVMAPILRINAQLSEAKQRAEDASLSKSEFLANMSHELRTPMNGILGMTQLVLESNLTQDQRECLAMAVGSAESLLVLLNEILDFSKVEAGKLNLESIEFQLRDCLAEAIGSVAMGAYEKGLDIVYGVGEDVPDRLAGDPGRLRQVLVNLVGNAIKFTPTGEITIQVENESLTAQSCVLCFSIRDTGIGIAPEKQALIFDAFSQADGSTTRRYGGTGLGLSICKRLAALMGGRIEVSSVMGEGSTFYFTCQFDILPDTSTTVEEKSWFLRHRMRVLVAEGQEVERRFLRGICSNRNIETTVVDDGAAALAAMEGGAFDCIVLDADLPGGGAFEIARSMRERWPETKTPMVLLVPVCKMGIDARCEAAGMDAYVVKPLRVGDFLRTLRDLSPAGRQARAASGGIAQAAARPAIERRDAERSLNVLVAEDNVVNQALARRLLEQQKHQVTIASNGEKALEAFCGGSFDLILMDLQMPEMDGYEATRRIRELEGGALKTPIVALTAHALSDDRDRCLAAGMNGFLTKPIRAAEIAKLLETLVSAQV